MDNKFEWVIKKVSSLRFKKLYSDQFFIGGCNWRVVASYNRKNTDDESFCLSLSLEVADAEYLPSGWMRDAVFSFTVINQQTSRDFSQLESICRDFTETRKRFGQDTHHHACEFASSFPLGKLEAKYGGFLRNGQVKIVVEVRVVEAIGESEQVGDSEDNWIDVYGFPVAPSEVELVTSMFEKHQDVASELPVLQPSLMYTHVKRALMFSLIKVVTDLGKPPQEISMDDLDYARFNLRVHRKFELNVGWLEKKLNHVTQIIEKQGYFLAARSLCDCS